MDTTLICLKHETVHALYHHSTCTHEYDPELVLCVLCCPNPWSIFIRLNTGKPHSHSTCQNKNLFIKENTALVKNNLNVNSFQENHFVFFTVMTCAVKGELADHEVASTLPHPQSSLCMCVRDYEIETGIQRKRWVSSMCACIKSCTQVCVYVVLLNFFLL